MERRSMQRLRRVTDGTGEDPGGADEFGDITSLDVADHLVENLPDAKGKDAAIGFLYIQAFVKVAPDFERKVRFLLAQIEQRFAGEGARTGLVHVCVMIWL